MDSITTAMGKPIEKWVEEFEAMPRSTFKDILKLPPTVAVALTVEFLKVNPTIMVRNLQDFRTWLFDEIPHIYRQAEQAATVATVVSTGKTVLEVRMNDTIRLRSRHERATNLLNKCGHWWVIVQARAGISGRKDQWYLRSLTRKQQGLKAIPGFNFENLWIDKIDDPNYEITQVCPFPKEFNYREYD